MKTHTEKHMGNIFLLLNKGGVRTKFIGPLKDIHVYILRIVQYNEVESSCLGLSNREELRLYHLKSKSASRPYSYVH